MPKLEIGWMDFGGNGQAPDFRMFDLDTDIGDRPGEKFKEGFRFRVKLTNGAGDDVRELASTAIGSGKVWRVHNLYVKGVRKTRTSCRWLA